jgi:ribosomal protein S18 acetylase RimI-like enzyme
LFFQLPHVLVHRLVPHIAAYRQSSFTIADFAAEHAAASFRYHAWFSGSAEPVAFCRTEETLRGRLYLSSFIVAPQYRGTGVAKAFLNDVLRNTNERIELKVHEDNVAARRLYENAGFVVQQKWNKRYEMNTRIM